MGEKSQLTYTATAIYYVGGRTMTAHLLTTALSWPSNRGLTDLPRRQESGQLLVLLRFVATGLTLSSAPNRNQLVG